MTITKKWVPFWVFPLLIVFSIGTVWLRLAIVRTTYRIHQVDREVESLRQQRELLQVKIAALRSPRRLESLARNRFGLSQPRIEQVIHIKKVENGAGH